MSDVKFYSYCFLEVVNEKEGKKGDANLLLGNYVIVKIVLIVLEAYSRIAFFSGRRARTGCGQDFCSLPDAKHSHSVL